MLGTVTFQRKGNAYSATLGDDYRWTATDPLVTDFLAREYAATPADRSPSAGQRGAALLARVAKRFGGHVLLPAVEPLPADATP